MADVPSREKPAQLLSMATPDDTVVVAIAHHLDKKTRFTVALETRRLSDLVGITSAVLQQAIAMTAKADEEHRWDYVLGQLVAAQTILEGITGETEKPELDA
jgi:hypothetical protein